jgi:hypothetical protein
MTDTIELTPAPANEMHLPVERLRIDGDDVAPSAANSLPSGEVVSATLSWPHAVTGPTSVTWPSVALAVYLKGPTVYRT